MSDTPSVESMLAASQGPEPEEVEEVNEEVNPPVEDDDDDEDDVPNFNGQTFLESIEEEELRQRLEPHVKKWDAGVTRRFQELHSQLKPYQELGELERLREAQQMYEILDTRPEDLYRALHQTLYGDQQVGQQVPGPQSPQPLGQQNGGGVSQTNPQGELTQQQYAQLPPEVQRQIDQQGQITEQLADAWLKQEQTRKQAEEDAALDSYMSNLKTEFGEFDEDYVLSKMLQGVDGPKAVKQYHKAVQKQAAQVRQQNAPKVISGGGQIPQDNVNVGEMDSKGVKNLVAGLVAQANQES